MIKITREEIRCASCKYGCDLAHRASDIYHRCPLQKITTWPGRNHFFSSSLLSMVAGKYESIFCRGCIFIDFSRENVRYFTNSNWIEYLKNTGLMLIIVSDRYMQSLAAFWQKEDLRIQTVIYADQSRDEISRQINGCYFGLKGDVRKKVNAFKQDEVQFLDLAVNGLSLPIIAREMGVEIKRVYNIKEAIRRKMGISLNQLLSV
ncbi:LuxR family transcriptional regulator [Pantoea sp. EKM101V]|uniref:LuxR family transcriptional regulator n=1 Tax=Pantoea sp. EKM101V TaxID=1683695 RepID=UPI0021032ADF|nr:LuxR family transcriptional regulator [Pantoea sp. EKM101V]